MTADLEATGDGALHMAGTETTPGVECECGGRQRHRILWQFSWCPACRGPGCAECRWKGVVALPVDRGFRLILSLNGLALLVLGIFWSPLLDWCIRALS